MTDALFGLSSESRTILDRYLQWTRLACDGLKRGVHLDAFNHQVGNIIQETYTRDELKDIISAHTEVLLHSLDARMEGFAAASAELLCAVLRDADRQRVTIGVDANAVLSAATATASAAMVGTTATGLLLDHERKVLGGPRGRLAPLTVADADVEASRQLTEAKEEIRRLQEKVHHLSDAYAQVMNTRDALNSHEAEATASQMAVHQKEQDEGSCQTVEELRVALAAAKQELNARLNQSTQYREVKKILAQKNEQIRKLRAHLAQFDPAFLQNDDGGGDTIVEQDD
ncbi:hypothetical protein TcYC6_0013760 [Trypanosoma cruzi]|nr:hypothetical protein TcYC6_0013760 [Trypanosoma cruzi]